MWIVEHNSTGKTIVVITLQSQMDAEWFVQNFYTPEEIEAWNVRIRPHDGKPYSPMFSNVYRY